MKKITVRILCAVLLGVLSIGCFAACGAKNNPDAGEYKGVYGKWVGSEDKDEDEDGTGTFKRDDNEFTVKEWKVEDGKFSMTEKFLGLENEYTGTLKDGHLEIYGGDPEDELTYMYVFEKK